MTIKKTSKNITIKHGKNIKHKNIKNIKNIKNSNNIKNHTRKVTHSTLQKGGTSKEKFELTPLSNFDYDKYKLSNYMNTNIDWGTMPGSPPMPDCCIL